MPSCQKLGRWTSRHRGPYTAPGIPSNHDPDVSVSWIWVGIYIEGVAEFRSAEIRAGHEETAERTANLALRNGINLHQLESRRRRTKGIVGEEWCQNAAPLR